MKSITENHSYSRYREQNIFWLQAPLCTYYILTPEPWAPNMVKRAKDYISENQEM